MGLLRPVDMRAQAFLLLPQGLLLFASDAFAAHDHHYRLVARFLAVRRAARRLLIVLALQRAELFPTFAAARYRRHAFLVVRFRLLTRAENVAFRDESWGVARARRRGGRLFGGFERREFALRSSTTPAFDRFGRSL